MIDKQPEELTLATDVLVVGGGPAGAWAALSARAAGADVVLVDKGYCGSSGATSTAGVGVWYVPPDPEKREAAMASREGLGGYLAERTWMERVLDETFRQVNRLAEWGYPFPVDDHGIEHRTSLQGPEYMRRMRRRVKHAGVRILDHSPALELLVDAEGAVGGAAGIRRQTGERWSVHGGAVVMATGGCAFLSGGLGCNVLTGDGALMGAEAGAELSGMEFSNAYAIAPAFSSVTKTAFYKWATFTYEDGSVIPGAGAQHGRCIIARTLLTQPVYAQLDQATDEMKPWLRAAQPNFFLPFDREGIDPFTQRFPVKLLLEGTVRGTGGLRITAGNCSTSVPGLFAAGDASTRELICGGFTGGGSHNAAWAISSGTWAGRGAAEHARRLRSRSRQLQGVGGAGLRPTGTPARAGFWRDVVAAVQAEVLPCDKNLFRTGDGLCESLAKLERVWLDARSRLGGFDDETVKAREAAALTAHARWMYVSGLARTETRGMHKRTDHPQLDPEQHHRLVSGGLDAIWTRTEAVASRTEVAA